MFDRLVANWVYGGFLAGLVLLVLTPLFPAGPNGATTLVALALPVYMIHQYEEHDADRFRRFVNLRLGGGHEILTLADVFWINIVGVWALLAADLWLTARVSPGWGVFAAYFLIANAALHIAQAATCVATILASGPRSRSSCRSASPNWRRSSRSRRRRRALSARAWFSLSTRPSWRASEAA